jgi:hypothetical protein
MHCIHILNYSSSFVFMYLVCDSKSLFFSLMLSVWYHILGWIDRGSGRCDCCRHEREGLKNLGSSLLEKEISIKLRSLHKLQGFRTEPEKTL